MGVTFGRRSDVTGDVTLLIFMGLFGGGGGVTYWLGYKLGAIGVFNLS